MKFWIGVASHNHVKVGESGGFAQLCHGKAAPLKRMRKGDFLIYYSSKVALGEKEPCQKFTALGQIVDDEVYQVEMFEGFEPYRKDVSFYEIEEYPIAPLIEKLSFIPDKKRWGYPFRYGHLEINEQDFLLIVSHLLSSEDYQRLGDTLHS